MASPSTSAEPKATNPSTSPLYSKLPAPTSVRLLRIKPPSAPDSNEVTCTLTEHSLSNPPTYNALSYTWNSPSPKTAAHDATKPTHCPITINSHPVLVTRNLFDFLLSFRNSQYENKNKDRNQSEELIWVDAVCINQSDTSEKTHQVRLMTQIYSLASTVYVWLGRILLDEDAKKTLGLLAAVYQMCDTLDSGFDSDGDGTSKMNAWDGKMFMLQPGTLGIPWEDRQMILGFLQKTWFSRIWIVQELVVAREVVMLWGEREIPWEFVVVVASYIETTPLGDYIKAAGEEDCEAVRGCGHGLEHYHEAPRRVDLGNPVLIANLRNRYLAGQSILLGEALTSTWQFHATDKRDLIFALLGIVQMSKPDDAADDLVVDYSLSAETVFEQAARYLWKVEKSYGHILDVVVPDATALASRSSPSWRPDFSHRSRPPLAFWATPCGSHFQIKSNTVAFRQEPCNWQGNLTGGTAKLRVATAYIDEVVACGEPIKQWRTSTGFMKSLEIISEMPKSYFNGQHRLEVFWRTLICNTWPKGPVIPAPAEAATSFKDWLLCTHFAHFNSGLVEGDPPGPMSSYMIDFLRDDEYDVIPNVSSFAVFGHPRSPTTHMLQPGASFHHAVQHFEDMQLFVTKKGYLGLGPATLKPGDTIWGAEFSRWLYAMREVPGADDLEKTKQLVGAVYAHGLTEGQFLKEVVDVESFGKSVSKCVSYSIIDLV